MSTADEDLRAEMRRLVARFGRSEAALYPFLNREVPTPEGPGELLQVFAGQCRVVVGGRLVRVPCDELLRRLTGGPQPVAIAEPVGTPARTVGGGGG